MAFVYDPPEGYRNTTVYPTKPANETDFRDSMMTLLDQIAVYVNTNPDNIHVVRNGDASIELEDTSQDLTDYRIKTIINTNTTANNAWLFRSIRPSDGDLLDYTLSGPDGNIFTSGNSPSNLSQTGFQTLANGWTLQQGTAVLSANQTLPITFPIGFAANPIVTFTVVAQNANAVSLQDSVSNTAFICINSLAIPVRVYWMAVGHV